MIVSTEKGCVVTSNVDNLITRFGGESSDSMADTGNGETFLGLSLSKSTTTALSSFHMAVYNPSAILSKNT